MNRNLLAGLLLSVAGMVGCSCGFKTATKAVLFDSSPRNLPLWLLYRQINSSTCDYECVEPEIAETAALHALTQINAQHRYTTRVGRSCTIYAYNQCGEAIIIDVDPHRNRRHLRLDVCIGRYGDRLQQAVFFSYIDLPQLAGGKNIAGKKVVVENKTDAPSETENTIIADDNTVSEKTDIVVPDAPIVNDEEKTSDDKISETDEATKSPENNDREISDETSETNETPETPKNDDGEIGDEVNENNDEAVENSKDVADEINNETNENDDDAKNDDDEKLDDNDDNNNEESRDNKTIINDSIAVA